MPEHAIELLSVVKRYGRFPVLGEAASNAEDGSVKALTVRIMRDQITAVVGHNGAGKTTLLDCISGFSTVQSGRVMVLGNDVTRWGAGRIAELGVARGFQHPADLPTTWSAVITGGSRDRFASLLDGRRPRLQHAGALLSRLPRILLLDEPTVGLSSDERQLLGESLRRAANQCGVTVVAVVHDLEFVDQFADRVLLLDDGSARLHVATKQALRNGHVQRVLGGSSTHGGGSGARAEGSGPAEARVGELILEGFNRKVGRSFWLEVPQRWELPTGIHLLTGPSGSGKSLLLEQVADRLQDRRCTLKWRSDEDGLLRSVDRPSVGWAPQDCPHVAELTVRECLRWVSNGEAVGNIDLGSRATLRELFPKLIDVGLAKQAVQLSGGMRQMLNLARAFVGAPQVLLLDQPFQHLDSGVRRNVTEYLKARSNESVVLVVPGLNGGPLEAIAASRNRMEGGRLVAGGERGKADGK